MQGKQCNGNGLDCDFLIEFLLSAPYIRRVANPDDQMAQALWFNMNQDEINERIQNCRELQHEHLHPEEEYFNIDGWVTQQQTYETLCKCPEYHRMCSH